MVGFVAVDFETAFDKKALYGLEFPMDTRYQSCMFHVFKASNTTYDASQVQMSGQDATWPY